VLKNEKSGWENKMSNWCGNCKHSKSTEEIISKDCIIVKVKCQYPLPIWVHVDDENQDEEQQRTFQYYKGTLPEFCSYGSTCSCHSK
jgi:hypothetical protein